MIQRLAMTGLAALAAAALAGCGKQADLDRPAPLFGHVRAPSAEALGRDQAAARARADGAASAGPQAKAPQSIDEVRNRGIPTHRSPVSAPPSASSVTPDPQ